jgi:hypothetical protein
MTDSQKIDVLARFVFHQYAMLSARVAALQQVVLKYGVSQEEFARAVADCEQELQRMVQDEAQTMQSEALWQQLAKQTDKLH